MRRTLIVLGLAWVVAMPVAAVMAQDPAVPSPEQQMQLRWDQQAGQTFGLGQGLARQLMTEEEWQEHRQKMLPMTLQEREQYQLEVHRQMAERARGMGILIPETPGPRGRMGGASMGGSGGGGRGGGGGGRAR